MSKTKEVLFRKVVNGVFEWFEDGNEEDHGKYVGDIENGEPNVALCVFNHLGGFSDLD